MPVVKVKHPEDCMQRCKDLGTLCVHAMYDTNKKTCAVSDTHGTIVKNDAMYSYTCRDHKGIRFVLKVHYICIFAFI